LQACAVVAEHARCQIVENRTWVSNHKSTSNAPIIKYLQEPPRSNAAIRDLPLCKSSIFFEMSTATLDDFPLFR